MVKSVTQMILSEESKIMSHGISMVTSASWKFWTKRQQNSPFFFNWCLQLQTSVLFVTSGRPDRNVTDSQRNFHTCVCCHVWCLYLFCYCTMSAGCHSDFFFFFYENVCWMSFGLAIALILCTRTATSRVAKWIKKYMLPCACFVHDDWKLSASCANWRNWTKRHRSHKIQYYKVHFQYYKLLSTTKYTSSTTKYYEVLQSPLQYYKVIQSITSYYKKPPSTAKYYSGTTPYYKVLNLQQVLRLPRKLTLELHQVLRLPRKVTLDLHQVLRLPHRMTRRLDPRHIWNVISNARRNKCHPPNSPNTAPATQNDHPTSGRNLRKTAETSFPMRGRSETVPRPFRAWSETVSVSPQPATPPRLLFTLRTNGLYWKIQHFALRLSFQISPSTAPTTKSDTWTSPSTAPTTQSDTWTSPSTAPTTKTDTWTSPSTAPTTKSDTWPSPSTAPATQNDSQAWSSSHMKRHFQCAQKQMSPSKLTKYCACHAKWPSNIWQKFAENSWNVISNARPIRDRSETVPSMIRDRFRQSATRHSTEVTFSLRTNGLYWKIQHFAFRLSFQISPSTAPTTKSDTWTSPSTAPTTQSDTWTSPSTAPTTKTDTWTSPSTAPTTKSDTWPSPSTAPATQNDSQAWSSSHMKRHFQCAQKQMSPSKLTKYCACHAKWPSNICRNLRKTAETSFPMRGRSKTVPRPFRAWSETVCVSPQPATQPRLLFALRTNGLYWKIQHFALRLSFQISPSPAPTTQSDTWTSPSTAPTTKTDTWTSPSTAPTTKSDTWPSPSTAPATQNDSQAWSSSHMKRHFQCAQKQMSPSKLTKYCACHAKWPSNIWQKFAENSWNVISNARPIRDRSETVPSMIRDRLRQSATRHATEVAFRAPDERFVLKNTTFRAPAIFPNFTKSCAYH